jgi:aryl-alcohol dehydrogenase-like predicted oxidoreductase
MQFLEKDVFALGMGCWPIGGAMYASDGQSLGYSNSNDKESIKAIHAALECGIRVFDTAPAYGAGHSERLLGEGLKDHPDALVITKIGIAIDEENKVLTGPEVDPATVLPAIDRCLTRLQRDSIDLLLLHQNDLSVVQADALFDEMDKARHLGKIRAYGWSTDFTESASAVCGRDGLVAIEHAMHVLMDAPQMQSVISQNNMHALIRSPLAMGLLTGKYGSGTTLPAGDIRATNQSWVKYYVDGKPNSLYIERFNMIRELLQSDGRSAVQGALSWLWAKNPINIPIPGARTVEQIRELAEALEFGALSDNVMQEIDRLVGAKMISDGRSAR